MGSDVVGEPVLASVLEALGTIRMRQARECVVLLTGGGNIRDLVVGVLASCGSSRSTRPRGPAAASSPSRATLNPFFLYMLYHSFYEACRCYQ